MTPVEGKHVVLTGAAGGIGTLLADRLRMAGAHTLGIDRTECAACHESLVTDLAKPAALAQLATDLGRRDVDILINLAGLQYFGPLDQQDPTSIALGYAVNLIAPTVLAGAVVPQMVARGDGQIVNIGSVMGSVPYPYFTAYSSAKAGLKALSQALRRELHGRGITVTHIAPRAIATRFNTAQVERFMVLSGMKADRPEPVADRIFAAIARREREVSIGGAERFFAQLNAALPHIVDRGLAGQTIKARALLSNQPQE